MLEYQCKVETKRSLATPNVSTFTRAWQKETVKQLIGLLTSKTASNGKTFRGLQFEVYPHAAHESQQLPRQLSFVILAFLTHFGDFETAMNPKP